MRRSYEVITRNPDCTMPSTCSFVTNLFKGLVTTKSSDQSRAMVFASFWRNAWTSSSPALRTCCSGWLSTDVGELWATTTNETTANINNDRICIVPPDRLTLDQLTRNTGGSIILRLTVLLRARPALARNVDPY